MHDSNVADDAMDPANRRNHPLQCGRCPQIFQSEELLYSHEAVAHAGKNEDIGVGDVVLFGAENDDDYADGNVDDRNDEIFPTGNPHAKRLKDCRVDLGSRLSILPGARVFVTGDRIVVVNDEDEDEDEERQYRRQKHNGRTSKESSAAIPSSQTPASVKPFKEKFASPQTSATSTAIPSVAKDKHFTCSTCCQSFKFESGFRFHLRATGHAEEARDGNGGGGATEAKAKGAVGAAASVVESPRKVNDQSSHGSAIPKVAKLQKKTMNSSSSTNGATEPSSCVICGELFASSAEVLHHTLQAHVSKDHHCPSCDASFYSLRDLNAHIQKSH